MSDRLPAVTVVGLVGGVAFGPGTEALADAEVVVGSQRQLSSARLPADAERLELRGPLDPLLDNVATRADAGHRVCVLASGDPGFFGIVRALAARLGPGRLAVHPAPSSVSLAFARLGLSWDDASVVSAHGRPLADAVAAALGPKVAVLTSPDNPPQRLGAALQAAGCGPREVLVASRLGEPAETVTQTDLDGLATGRFHPLSVVVLLGPPPTEAGPGVRWGAATPAPWGLPVDAFEHRAGMITKPEVRAVVLSKLALPSQGVLWDLGAGSGSVAIECARLQPGLRVFAVERDPAAADQARANAKTLGAVVEVVTGSAPDALAGLPDPDRVFVGGGGLSVLDAALERLAPGGVVAATYALIDRAASAERRLGHLVQLSVARGVPAGEAGTRLAAENPVFVAWGPVGPAPA